MVLVTTMLGSKSIWIRMCACDAAMLVMYVYTSSCMNELFQLTLTLQSPIPTFTFDIHVDTMITKPLERAQEE